MNKHWVMYPYQVGPYPPETIEEYVLEEFPLETVYAYLITGRLPFDVFEGWFYSEQQNAEQRAWC